MNTNLSRVAGRTALRLRKHAPALLFGAGITGTVATVVVACRATLKASEVHKRHQAELSVADARHERGVYNKDTHRHAVVSIWAASSTEYVKLYGPAFILGVSSIACLTKSHQILTQRNAAVMTAYAGLDTMFKSYRKRVVDELGLEKDTEFAHGKAEEKTVTGYDEKGNGTAKKVKTAPKDAKTAYGRLFDESNRHWDKDHGYNHTFLDNTQTWANLLLKKDGHLFLNEVYDMLGMERTIEGQQVGWVYDSDEGDCYVDFGFNRYPDFVAGFERSVFLDFNVDGVILDVLDKR